MSDDESGFSARLRPDSIIEVHLANWKRCTIDAWMANAKAHDGRLQPPLRILYDMRTAGPPSQYLLDVIGPFVATLTIPEDTRNAYVFQAGPFERFVSSFIRRMPPNAGAVRAFTTVEDAISWLLQADV